MVARTNNSQNQLTSVDSNPLTYDNNGNMTTDDLGRTLIYDAWNRLMAVNDSNGNTLTTYAYDGLNHRITESPAGQAATQLYYSAQWQVIEERVDSQTSAQYVWSPVYVNALILRDDQMFGRIYALQDANFNTTAILCFLTKVSYVVDGWDPNFSGTWSGWEVTERLAYDSYGSAMVLNSDWTAQSNDYFNWKYTFQGGRQDAITGFINFQRRDYNPRTYTWNTQDQLIIDGLDRYRLECNNPINHTDWNGMQATQPGTTMPATTMPDVDKQALWLASDRKAFDDLIDRAVRDQKISEAEARGARAEAIKIVDAYMAVWNKYANSPNSYAMRIPGNKNQNINDAHAGWMCWQWKELVYAGVSGLGLKHFEVYKSSYATINPATGKWSVEHSWVTVSLLLGCENSLKQNPRKAPDETYTLRLDPWLRTSPLIYTPEQHGDTTLLGFRTFTANIWDFGPSALNGDIFTGTTTIGGTGQRYLDTGSGGIITLDPLDLPWSVGGWRKTN